MLSFSRLAHVFIAFSSLTSAVRVHDVFIVKAGTSKGGCDGHNVEQWFSDSQTLINSAAAGARATDTDSRKYLQSFFSIKPNDDARQAGSKFTLSTIIR